MQRRFIVFAVLISGLTFAAGPLPYNEQAEAKAEVRQALSEARAANVQRRCGDREVQDANIADNGSIGRTRLNPGPARAQT